MKATLWLVITGSFLFAGSKAGSAEVPTPAATSEGDAGVQTSTVADRAAGDAWRYKQHNGQWWYWLPSNRWVVWTDGRWMDPPTESIAGEDIPNNQYLGAPQYIAPRASVVDRLRQPRPKSWYYTEGVYDGPSYYYDEFYSPYGGARPYDYYPVPRPYSRRPYSYGQPGYYGQPHYGQPGYYGQPGTGFSIGGGRSGVQIGIGF